MLELAADCSRCFGLCCVALPFATSVDFPTNKDAGDPCHHLRPDFRCGIHAQLREEGYRGCTVYDCFGAGQQVAQVTFGGEDWRGHPETARQMFSVFLVMRQVHELLWYLTEALTVPGTEPVRDELRRAVEETEHLTRLDAEALERLDVPAHRAVANGLLRRASALARAGVDAPDLPRDLVGATLGGRDLRGAELRGACLIAADLTGADLRMADLTGADLRDARLHGADLSTALFVTQAQLGAAVGDLETKLPISLERPPRWT
jgi:uncharacterized protein YjbI with pentapeptide repeats